MPLASFWLCTIPLFLTPLHCASTHDLVRRPTSVGELQVLVLEKIPIFIVSTYNTQNVKRAHGQSDSRRLTVYYLTYTYN